MTTFGAVPWAWFSSALLGRDGVERGPTPFYATTVRASRESEIRERHLRQATPTDQPLLRTAGSYAAAVFACVPFISHSARSQSSNS